MATKGQPSRTIDKQQREVIKKMKDEAAGIMSKARFEVEQEEELEAALAKVVLVNTMTHYGNNMQFQEKIDWSGELLVSSYPASIPSGDSGRFQHIGLYPSHPQGSIGAVVYVGNSVEHAPNDCAWIVAWNNPGYCNQSQPNQVYVEAGHISKYGEGRIDWDEIKSKLLSSSQESYYEDQDTGARAYAEVGSHYHVVIPALLGVSRPPQ